MKIASEGETMRDYRKFTEKLFTVAQASRALGFDGKPGHRRVRRLILSGKLRAEDHGTGKNHFWMVTEAALAEYLERRGRFRGPSEYLQ